MKILLASLCCIILALAAVVVTGYLLPKRHVVTRSALYQASPERVFGLISGPPTWRPEVAKFEILPDTGQGPTVRETTSNGETISYEVVRSQPPSLMVRRIADKNLPYGGTWTYRIEPSDGHTRLSITEDGEVYNPVFRFASRFVIGHTRTIDTFLRNLGGALGESVTIQE
jgi:hypothetical protein